MDFTLKKIISALLLPLPLALLCFAIGLLCLWFMQRKTLSSVFLCISFIILSVFGFSALPTSLINSLEDQTQPITRLPHGIHQIVVLGGGVRSDTNAPPNTQLSSASLSRLIEGVRLYKLYRQQHQAETLILSGGKVFGKPAEAGVMQNIAVILGVNPKAISLERGSRDTAEEATHLKSMLHNQRFLLVTSAYHMPRALAIFKKKGLKPIAAPTQYFNDKNQPWFKCILPSANNLIMSDIAIHEYLGQLWSHITGSS